MEQAETRVDYYFEGDPALPISLIEPDASISQLTSTGRKSRLSDWLNDEATIEGTIEPGAFISGPVYVGAGTVIHSGAEITGPVFIGKNCSIRHGAQLRSGTILGNECVVGHSAEIKNSMCLSGSKMQSGVFVGDSVLGLGARLGSGTILANRRFGQDNITLGSGPNKLATEEQFFGAIIGDYARLGANVVTAPGTLVGPYTWVSSLVSLHGFVPRSKLVMLKQDIVLRDKDDTQLRSGQGEYEVG